ncbi:MAG: BPTD_3080 family restriction endonuclease [Candidatus Limnocylindria bacterium]
MATATIDRLIVNSPYLEPTRHWSYDATTRLFELVEGRRPAGYVVASTASKSFDDPGIFLPLELPNQIRPRVKAWREAGYPGTSGITKRLLEHWYDPEQRPHPFFFCQLEAIETLIWLTEAPDADRQGVAIPSDGGEFQRLCAKMATGSGKTVVMAMLIAWQVLNKVTYPQDTRFAKAVFVVAPGLTVRSRLQVLVPSSPGNFYDLFSIVPPGLEEKLRQGRVLVRNWHLLAPLDPKDGPKVVKKGPESDEAFARRVLEDLAATKGLLVINDEAHHAWRVPPKTSARGVGKDVLEEATVWVGGLDRIHRGRGILGCYDFSATPFAPTGKASGEETLFGWIVSDFGLNDAIESGLVKTPRVVVRDDGKLSRDYKSRLYHIYNDPEVKADLGRPSEPKQPLPDLVVNAYYLLGKDWLETATAWAEAGHLTPPVMITVANRADSAARVYNAFSLGKIHIDQLRDPARTLHIDTKVLEKAEAREEQVADLAPEPDADVQGNGDAPERKLTKADQAELLRRTVDTIGQIGQPGEQIQCVISVGMLNEGWDAKTVTHIMGLRAFTSQLLCEQVVGRGLRRTSYEINPETGLFDAEYVNIFGVPFTFLPHEGDLTTVKKPTAPTVPVFPDPTKADCALTWPNVVRIDRDYRPQLTLNLAKVSVLTLNASDVARRAELAPVLGGKPDLSHLTPIDLEELARRFRLQRIVFEAARDVFDQLRPTWRGTPEALLPQVIRLVDRFVASDRLQIVPAVFNRDELRRRLIVTLNMNKVVNHVFGAIHFENAEALTPIFDTSRPLRGTADMGTWYTTKPRERALRSHINVCVFDSSWEAGVARLLDADPRVAAWAKNDHLGFEVTYVYSGVVKKYRPDFLIKLTNGVTLVLEVKGQDTQDNRTKREFLDEWVRAVNAHGGFGTWAWDVSLSLDDAPDVIERHYPFIAEPTVVG